MVLIGVATHLGDLRNAPAASLGPGVLGPHRVVGSILAQASFPGH